MTDLAVTVEGGIPHVHAWVMNGGIVIDTAPPQYPYTCECGAFTHDPEVGTPCEACAPADYALRGPTITLRGGPYDGKRITRPVNRSVNLRADSLAKRVQKFVTYEETSDPGVWKFRSNSWTVPFVDRDDPRAGP